MAFKLWERDRISWVLLGYAALSLLTAGLVQMMGLNAPLFVSINHFAGEHLPDELLWAITMFGEQTWQMALISPLLLVAPRVNAAALYATPFVLVFTHVPKLLLHWARPSTVLADHGAHLIHAPVSMNTFPSGHAVVSGMIAAILFLGWDVLKQRPWTVLPVLAMATLICASRIAVGAHWPVDVLAGVALGIVAGHLGTALAARHHSDSARSCVAVAVLYGVVALVLALIPTHHPALDQLRNLLASIGCVSALATITRIQVVALRRGVPIKPAAMDRAAVSPVSGP